MKHLKLKVFGLSALLFSLSLTVFAQSDRGNMVGTVRDPNGAVVPAAKVTVTNLESGEVRETKTSDEGNYNVPELKAAPYKIKVEAEGFKSATVERVQIAVQVT